MNEQRSAAEVNIEGDASLPELDDIRQVTINRNCISIDGNEPSDCLIIYQYESYQTNRLTITTSPTQYTNRI